MPKYINELSAKLDQILSLIPAIEKDVLELRNDLAELKESFVSLYNEVEALRGEINAVSQHLKVAERTIQELQKSHDQQLLRNIRLEARSRRNNVKFFGLPEARQVTDLSKEDTEDVLRSFLVNNLKMPKEMVEEFFFERVHRMPAKRADTSNAPRPIIAKFYFFQQKERIWRYVRILKGTNFGMANDYPKKIDDIRKAV